MAMNEQDRVDLYRAFVKKMRLKGYSTWYIGEQLALLIWAIETKEGQ